MCGINGIVSLSSAEGQKPKDTLLSRINTMNDKIVHRGPDSDGCFIEHPVAFGFRRLSIIDLDNHANRRRIISNNTIDFIAKSSIIKQKIKLVSTAKIYNSVIKQMAVKLNVRTRRSCELKIYF
ncbi:hypothetical protein JQC67_06675 [Aurantibacter crassamenti]|uniref:hypothetical protein n=1 Tax=Aurantibacter crassamenti TaxID=1837375 RepID=UPI001939FBC9|nr:hypothetical protein [Aurantibacter crassamenti]MBM1105813.1 hypothetical protein [Aurantibacter crassamenti]